MAYGWNDLELAQNIEKEEILRVAQTNLVDEGLVGSNPNSENNEVGPKT